MVGILPVLGVGEFLGGLFERVLGDGFGLEGFELVAEGFVCGLGLGQRVFKFFDAFAGRQVILCGVGFAAGDLRGVELAAQPPTEPAEEGGGEGKDGEEFDDQPEVSCVHDGMVGWESMRLRGGGLS